MKISSQGVNYLYVVLVLFQCPIWVPQYGLRGKIVIRINSQTDINTNILTYMSNDNYNTFLLQITSLKRLL